MKASILASLLSRAESHRKAGRRKRAKFAYQEILEKHSQSTEAHFQLAILLFHEHDIEGAVRHFQCLLQLSPELAEIHFNLGTVLAMLGRNQQAAESFERAISLQPSMADAHNNLGIALGELGDIERAITSFESAIQHSPRFVAALLNLGTTLIEARCLVRAVEVCRIARDLDPDLADTHLALGLALELAGEDVEAIQCFQEAVRRNPQSADWQFHFAAFIGMEAPSIAPRDYVASLFDTYAAQFDKHLRGSLRYQTPEHILKAVLAAAPDQMFDILDLGCGTGLCGELFRPFASRIVGVDLSSEMIRAANNRSCYDALEVNDIVSFLKNQTAMSDLILAADVFVYVGDLSETFHLSSAALRANGLFAFSVEAADAIPNAPTSSVGYHLNRSRRYSHSLAYIRQLATEHEFFEHSVTLKSLRTQGGQDVQGWIVVLEK